MHGVKTQLSILQALIHFGEILESIDDIEEIYTYNSLEEREANGEFDEPSIKQKYDFDLTCRKFIESSKVLEVLQEITPQKMYQLIQNNKNYKDFKEPLFNEMDEGTKRGFVAMTNIISNNQYNSHFKFLDNTDVLHVIDNDTIEEKTSQYFLDNKIKNFNNLEVEKEGKLINSMYKKLINEMDINLKDDNIVTYYNKNQETYVTEVNLQDLGINNFVRLETSPLDGIKKVAENVEKVDDTVLTEAAYEEMLEENSPIYASIKKLYAHMYGENYFTSEDALKEQIKYDLKSDYLTFNDDITENSETYIWYSYGKEDYAINAMDSSLNVLEGKDVLNIFGIDEDEKENIKQNEDEGEEF